jgi:hypothetical protein
MNILRSAIVPTLLATGGCPIRCRNRRYLSLIHRQVKVRLRPAGDGRRGEFECRCVSCENCKARGYSMVAGNPTSLLAGLGGKPRSRNRSRARRYTKTPLLPSTPRTIPLCSISPTEGSFLCPINLLGRRWMKKGRRPVSDRTLCEE